MITYIIYDASESNKFIYQDVLWPWYLNICRIETQKNRIHIFTGHFKFNISIAQVSKYVCYLVLQINFFDSKS